MSISVVDEGWLSLGRLSSLSSTIGLEARQAAVRRAQAALERALLLFIMSHCNSFLHFSLFFSHVSSPISFLLTRRGSYIAATAV